MRWSPGCTCCEDPSVPTLCCQTTGVSDYLVTGLVKVPADSVLSESCTPLTYPCFGNLIVEVNGQLQSAVGAGSDCFFPTSYSVPNTDACFLPSLSGFSGGGCVWSGWFPGPAGCTISGSEYRANISVGVNPGVIYGHFIRVRNNCYGAFGNGFGLAQFRLNYDNATVPDLSAPIALPCISTPSDSGGPYYDVAEPMWISL